MHNGSDPPLLNRPRVSRQSSTSSLFSNVDESERHPHARQVAPVSMAEHLGADEGVFPMYVMRMSDFLALDRLQPHNECMRLGLLVQIEADDAHSSCNFVSHQWCGLLHADPDGAHLRTMQEVFRMVASGGEIFRSASDRLSFYKGYNKTNGKFIAGVRHSASLERRSSSVGAERGVSVRNTLDGDMLCVSSGTSASEVLDPPDAARHSSANSPPGGAARDGFSSRGSLSAGRLQLTALFARSPLAPHMRRKSSPFARRTQPAPPVAPRAACNPPSGTHALREDGMLKKIFALSVKDGYVWMDYISIPQKLTCEHAAQRNEAIRDQRAAIASIPAYVARATNFWICAPSGVPHDSGHVCDFSTWAVRGWCRMEECCLAICKRGDGRPLLVTQPLGEPPRVQVHDSMDRLTVHTQRHTAVLTGDFTCCQNWHVHADAVSGLQVRTPCDKEALRPVLTAMYEAQLAQLRAEFESSGEHSGAAPFWKSLSASIGGNGAFFKHLLLRMNRTNLLADSLCEPADGESPPGAEGMPPCWSKQLDELDDNDLEEYLSTWGAESVEAQRAELPSLAVREGHLPLLRYIVEVHGAPLELGPNAIGLTPLQEASRIGATRLCAYLLRRYGAEACVVNHSSRSSGCSALSDAAMRGHAETCALLLAHGAHLDSRRVDGKTALHCAAEEGYEHVVRLLLEAGADPLALEEEGRTPLRLSQPWKAGLRALLVAAEELARAAYVAVGPVALAGRRGAESTIDRATDRTTPVTTLVESCSTSGFDGAVRPAHQPTAASSDPPGTAASPWPGTAAPPDLVSPDPDKPTRIPAVSCRKSIVSGLLATCTCFPL